VDVRQWLSPIAPADLMPRIVALENNGFGCSRPARARRAGCNVTPDATQSYGIDCGARCRREHRTRVGRAPSGHADRRSKRAARPEDSTLPLVQVTNLGINVKDSPQSTLVFVTRLDNGEAVADATSRS
jgi:hypothetical protein